MNLITHNKTKRQKMKTTLTLHKLNIFKWHEIIQNTLLTSMGVIIKQVKKLTD